MTNGRSSPGRALAAGLLGAATMTAAHEATRKLWAKAPRMERVGERGLVRLLALLGLPRPEGRALYGATLAGDLVSNGVYYGALLLGHPRRPFAREASAGLVAGVGALLLPPLLGLGKPPRSRHASNRAATVGLYLLGGLATAAAFRLLRGRQ